MKSIRAQPGAVRSWARRLVAANETVPPLELVRNVVDAVAASYGGFPAFPGSAIGGAAEDGAPEPLSEPPGGWADCWLPGLVHEQAVSAADRNARGAWYTPETVVRGLIRLAMPDDAPPPRFAADPTCGGGAFLLAALDRYVELGLEPVEALTRVAGLDIDPGAVAVSRWSVELWAAAAGVDPGEVVVDVSCGDALTGSPAHWPPVRLVMGNPPFATPLRTGAVPPEVQAFRAGREHLLGPYTDLAAMHLLAAVDHAAVGSSVVLVQPQSVLAGRDGTGIRNHCDGVAPVRALWAARESVFDAGVRACAVVLEVGSSPGPDVQLAAGPDVEDVGAIESVSPSSGNGWARYAARALGAPALPSALSHHRPPAASLGSMVTATAGFRDEYYGLVEACREWEQGDDTSPNRLLTVGSVDPLSNLWGRSRCKFGGKSWLRPWIELDALSPKVRTWTERRLEPKLVLATQSRLLEPVIDRDGSLVPATPLIAVHAAPDDLDLVAAVFLSPPVVAWAWQRWFGSALAVDALKLAARQVIELPLPEDRDLWERAAALIATSGGETADPSLLCGEVATIMNRAYGADSSVLEWWRARAKGR